MNYNVLFIEILNKSRAPHTRRGLFSFLKEEQKLIIVNVFLRNIKLP